MGNAALLINASLQALLQIQQYQATLAKANAEGRDVTDEEVAEAKLKAQTAIDALASAPAAA
jgi:hypothetical protein